MSGVVAGKHLCVRYVWFRCGEERHAATERIIPSCLGSSIDVSPVLQLLGRRKKVVDSSTAIKEDPRIFFMRVCSEIPRKPRTALHRLIAAAEQTSTAIRPVEQAPTEAATPTVRLPILVHLSCRVTSTHLSWVFSELLFYECSVS